MAEVKARGVDVSQWQGVVDFNKVKKAGYSFVMIRGGFGKYANQKDPYFEQNYKNAKAAGLDVGLYWYSYAKSKDEAIAEANVCYETCLKGKQYEYGIYFDIEDPSQGYLWNSTIQDMIEGFCSTLEKKGYYVGYYSYVSFLYNKVPLAFRNSNKYDLWVANFDVPSCTYNSYYGMWQFTSTGRVPGIQGDVDLNYSYKDYPALIKAAGLNGFKKKTEEKVEKTDTVKKENTEKKEKVLKSVDEIAGEVLDGKWGNGTERKTKLEKAGYNYKNVQNRVEQYLTAIDDVLRGLYGNGTNRVKALTAAGYNYDTIQRGVNRKLGSK